MDIKRFDQTQKFRVIVGDACFYATAEQIRYGVGELARCNSALREALESLETYRSGSGIESCATGQAGEWQGLRVQLDVI